MHRSIMFKSVFTRKTGIAGAFERVGRIDGEHFTSPRTVYCGGPLFSLKRMRKKCGLSFSYMIHENPLLFLLSTSNNFFSFSIS